MINLCITKAEAEIILFLIRNFPDETDYLDVLYNEIVNQMNSQEG